MLMWPEPQRFPPLNEDQLQALELEVDYWGIREQAEANYAKEKPIPEPVNDLKTFQVTMSGVHPTINSENTAASVSTDDFTTGVCAVQQGNTNMATITVTFPNEVTISGMSIAPYRTADGSNVGFNEQDYGMGILVQCKDESNVEWFTVEKNLSIFSAICFECGPKRVKELRLSKKDCLACSSLGFF
jgi:hypothetical protein